MKIHIPLVFALVVFGLPILHAQEFKSLFNGEDLNGWSGNKDLWTVKDGAITGTTRENAPIAHNTFLIWEGQVKDFTFKAQFRLVGDNNSVSYTHLTLPTILLV